MTVSDGLVEWKDGSGLAQPSAVPSVEQNPPNVRLWVVRESDVVYADELSAFGQNLNSKMVKHTNLTGGQSAHCGGELVWIDNDTIVMNGASGRYAPRSKAEMDDVGKAFYGSGYIVYSLGFDVETMFPFRFGDREPELV